MDVSELIGETTDFEVEWNGKKVAFTARKASLTPHLLNNIQSAGGYAKALAGVLTDWDLADKQAKWWGGEPKKWPIDEDHIAQLPIEFLSAILDKIGESWSGEKKSVTPSPNGSAATA